MSSTDDRDLRSTLDPHVVKLGLVLSVGALAVVFDTTIVSVALEILSRELDVGVTTIQWVTTAYLLALGMAVPLSTWVLERFGERRTWTASLALFLAASAGAALAWDAASLITWRVVQGFAGGLLMPVMGTLMVQAAAGKALGRTISIAMLPLTAGPVLGPLVGGLVLTHATWRAMFWINVPLCVTGLVLAVRYLPRQPSRPTAPPRLDLRGFLLLAPAIASLLLGLTEAGRSRGPWQTGVLVPGAVGIALLALFCLHALRVERPLVDLRLLAHRSLASASAVLFFNAVAVYGPLLLLPLYYLEGRGETALGAGVILVPEATGTAVGLAVAGRVTDMLGARRAAVAATVLVTLATVPFAFVTAGTSGWWMAVWLLLRGVGLGAVGVPAMAGAYRGLERAEMGHSTVLTRTLVQIGGALGTAVLAAVLVRSTAVHGGDVVPAVNDAFAWSVVLGAATIAVALTLPGPGPLTRRTVTHPS